MSTINKRLDALGDRLKSYERIETDQKFRPNSWLYVRIDGRGFSKFTKGLERPYDKRMSELMIEMTKYIVDEFNCTIGYTQSDESSFIIKNEYGASCAFDGKKQKLISSIAASATGFFNAKLSEFLPEKVGGKIPTFDCRIFEVPNEIEAMNAMYWRELDCIKNSVSMAAHDNFSHKELHKKNSKDMKDMLLSCRGISWDEYPNFFKYGTYCKRVMYYKQVFTHERDPENVLRHKIDVVNHHLSKIEDLDKKVDFIVSKSVEVIEN